MVVAVRLPELEFRQSDVGPIPPDWRAIEIGHLFDIRAGGDLDRPTFSEQADPEHPYPVFANAHRNDGLYGYSSVFQHRGDAVTITARGEIGYAVPRYCPFTAIGRLLVLTPKGNTNVKFVSEFINSRLKFAVESTGVPQLTAPQVSKYKLALPGTSIEQEAIGTLLSQADGWISGLENLVAKKQQIKQGVMHELLSGQRRLPQFQDGAPLLEDDFGLAPSAWVARSLQHLRYPARPIRYGIVQPGPYDPSGRYMIRGQDYSAAKGWADPSDVFRVSEGIEARYKNARVNAGDLLMTIVGYCGHVEIVPDWLDQANLTQTTARISIDPRRANPQFCAYALKSSYGATQVAARLKGNAQPGLNCSDIERFQIRMPSREEQDAIANIIGAMDSEISALEQKLEKASLLKEAMVQELLSGRIRLV